MSDIRLLDSLDLFQTRCHLAESLVTQSLTNNYLPDTLVDSLGMFNTHSHLRPAECPPQNQLRHRYACHPAQMPVFDGIKSSPSSPSPTKHSPHLLHHGIDIHTPHVGKAASSSWPSHTL